MADRSVRLTHRAAGILQRLSSGGITFEHEGTRTRVTWTPAYDERIRAQSEAPGFPFADRLGIRHAIPQSGRARLRRARRV